MLKEHSTNNEHRVWFRSGSCLGRMFNHIFWLYYLGYTPLLYETLVMMFSRSLRVMASSKRLFVPPEALKSSTASFFDKAKKMQITVIDSIIPLSILENFPSTVSSI
jgi:hypothetical protein